jgi:hypothetical protein
MHHVPKMQWDEDGFQFHPPCSSFIGRNSARFGTFPDDAKNMFTSLMVVMHRHWNGKHGERRHEQ